MDVASRARRWSVVAIFVLVGAIIGGVSWSRSNSHPATATLAAAQSVRSPGGQIFYKWCSDCHSTATGSGTMALERRYKGTPPAILEQRNDLPADYVKAVVRSGISFMPSFRKTEISDVELEQLATYLAKGADRPSQSATRP